MSYFINEIERCVVNGKTGEILRPSCYDDLILYHKYILGQQGEKEASNLLKRVVEGEKVMTNMINFIKG